MVLEEFTEVIIAPKQRSIASSSKKSESPAPLNRGQQTTSHHLKEKENSSSKSQVTESSHMTKNTPVLNPDKPHSKDTYSSKVYHWWNYFLHGEEKENNKVSQADSTNENQIINAEINCTENNFGDGVKRNCCQCAFETTELDLCLRCHGMGGSQIIRNEEISCEKEDRFLEQFTVFVHPSTVGFHKLKCGYDHPVVFPEDYEGLAKTVMIKKVLSPRERIELLNISKGKSKGNETSQGNQERKDAVPKLGRYDMCFAQC